MINHSTAIAYENVKIPADIAAAAGLYDECTVDIRGTRVITTFWPASGSDTSWIDVADEPAELDRIEASIEAATSDPAGYALSLIDIAADKLRRGEIERN